MNLSLSGPSQTEYGESNRRSADDLRKSQNHYAVPSKPVGSTHSACDFLRGFAFVIVFCGRETEWLLPARVAPPSDRFCRFRPISVAPGENRPRDQRADGRFKLQVTYARNKGPSETISSTSGLAIANLGAGRSGLSRGLSICQITQI
jgi:hypothetical protein